MYACFFSFYSIISFFLLICCLGLTYSSFIFLSHPNIKWFFVKFFGCSNCSYRFSFSFFFVAVVSYSFFSPSLIIDTKRLIQNTNCTDTVQFSDTFTVRSVSEHFWEWQTDSVTIPTFISWMERERDRERSAFLWCTSFLKIMLQFFTLMLNVTYDG